MERTPWGWAGQASDFLGTTESIVEESLRRHTECLLGRGPSGTQTDAWRTEGEALRRALRDVAIARPEATRWGVALEYELPLEGGRRPDVVILAGRTVVVLEFKDTTSLDAAHLDQAAAYARDLGEYHHKTHDLPVIPAVVYTKRRVRRAEVDGVQVLEARDLPEFLDQVGTAGELDLNEWLMSRYEPLPTLIQAARMIFAHQRLPAIRRHLSSGVPEAVELLGRIAEGCQRENERALSLLAGVPGSGKTLAGLQLVYERSASMGSAVFLSGNGPLVVVLRDALKSKVFVRDLHAFIKTFSNVTRVPETHVVVFDEAQRAWDAGYMEEKKGVAASEADLLIGIAERIPEWSSLVGLVGDGQEIHAGEEGGIQQWGDALRNGQMAWSIHCPPKMASAFEGLNVVVHSALDLTVSLRSRVAEALHDWVAALLAGDLAEAAVLARRIRSSAFPIYLTRDLESAKKYVREFYDGHPDARYGIVASARTQTFLPRHGVDSSFPATKRVKYGDWYNKAPGERGAGGNFEDVVTEFGCQGLELDMPIVAWGDDYRWDGSGWFVKPGRPRYPLKSPESIRRNAYRVLLTRGRDGLVIFVPPAEILDPTEIALLAAGAQPLQLDLLQEVS